MTDAAMAMKKQSWRQGKVGDCVAELSAGTSVNGVDEPAEPGEVGVLKVSCVTTGTFRPEQSKRVIETDIRRVTCSVEKDRIIVSRANAPDLVGASALIDRDMPNLYLSDKLWKIRAQDGYDPAWLHFVLSSPVVRKRLSSGATGSSSSMKNISKDFFLGSPIAIPPFAEQRKIAQILSTWGEALEKLASLRESKLRRHRELTKALVFGSWQLEKFRTTNEVTHYRWFQLPASWNCQQIGELSVEISERNGGGDQHEVLSCSKHEGFVRSLEYFKKQIFSSDLTGYKKIWRGDFGFPSNHIEEGSIGLQNLADTGVVSPIYTVFRFNPDEVLAEYAFAVLKTELYRHIFEISTSASVDRRGSLRWSEFSRIPFPVPPLAEQEAIAEVLRASRRELDSLRDDIGAVTRQKRGLMQKLLTGAWRVSC